ncbi:MAG: glycoside hydrolase family 108 protein [Alsobacter sp.]
MENQFEAALAAVLRFEGGFVDDPRDPGGATKFGITCQTLSEARGSPVDAGAVRALGRAEAASIYRSRYWNAVRGDDLPAGVDLAVFDMAVHAGPRRAALLLQESLGVRADGVIGPATLTACRASGAALLADRICDRRLAFLQSLPTWSAFGRGWSHRVDAVRSLARRAAATSAPAPHSVLPSKEPAMSDVKSILASRTVWSNAVGLAALGLSAVGFDTTGLDAPGLVDAGLQVVAGGSFIASTLFRVLATRRLVAAR